MSVSGSPVPPVESYDDIRRDYHILEIAATEAEHNSVDGSAFWSPGSAYEAVDTRDMASELVAIEINKMMVRVRETGGTGQTPGHVDSRLEISTSESMENLPGVTSELIPHTGQGSDFDQDTDTGPSLQHEVFSDTEVLLTMFRSGTSAFNDTVNGTGGGAQNHEEPLYYIDFRDRFGRGPIFDRQDEIWFHVLVQGIQSPDQWWQQVSELTFYWNDFQLESRY